MATQLTGLIEEALQLHPADRAKLIDALYASLESGDILVREQAWAREAESRLEAFDNGDINSESWDDLRARLRR